MLLVAVCFISFVTHCSTAPSPTSMPGDFINAIKEAFVHLDSIPLKEDEMLYTPSAIEDKTLVPYHLTLFIEGLEGLKTLDTAAANSLINNLKYLRGSCTILQDANDVAGPDAPEKPLPEFVEKLKTFLEMLNRKVLLSPRLKY